METLAVAWAHFHYYLYNHKVKVYTDHIAVKAALDAPNPTGKHARWYEDKSGIKEVQITHRASKMNVNANALSRSPQATPPTSENDDCVIIQFAVVDLDNVYRKILSHLTH